MLLLQLTSVAHFLLIAASCLLFGCESCLKRDIIIDNTIWVFNRTELKKYGFKGKQHLSFDGNTWEKTTVVDYIAFPADEIIREGKQDLLTYLR